MCFVINIKKEKGRQTATFPTCVGTLGLPTTLAIPRRIPSAWHPTTLQDLVGHVLGALIRTRVGGDTDLLHLPRTTTFRDVVAAAVALATLQALCDDVRLGGEPFRDLVIGYENMAHVRALLFWLQVGLLPAKR